MSHVVIFVLAAGLFAAADAQSVPGISDLAPEPVMQNADKLPAGPAISES
jgi:hypothetical protein